MTSIKKLLAAALLALAIASGTAVAVSAPAAAVNPCNAKGKVVTRLAAEIRDDHCNRASLQGKYKNPDTGALFRTNVYYFSYPTERKMIFGVVAEPWGKMVQYRACTGITYVYCSHSTVMDADWMKNRSTWKRFD